MSVNGNAFRAAQGRVRLAADRIRQQPHRSIEMVTEELVHPPPRALNSRFQVALGSEVQLVCVESLPHRDPLMLLDVALLDPLVPFCFIFRSKSCHFLRAILSNE